MRTILISFLASLIVQNLYAAEVADSIDYPELQVVPRASERLTEEAQFERDFGILTHWTYLTSGLLTLTAGSMQGGKHRDPNATSAQAETAQTSTRFSQIIGGGTILLAAYMAFDRPYSSQLEKVRRIKTGNKRAELLKERMAEEGLERPATLIQTTDWLVFASNLIAASAVLESGADNVRTYAIPALFASTLPLLFQHPYVTVFEKHQEYKRKIYTPIVMWDQNRNPVVGMAWAFD